MKQLKEEATHPDWLIIGRFGRPHGLKGFVNVNSFTEPKENILNYSTWYVFEGNAWRQVNRCDVDVHAKLILAQIEGYEDRDRCERLKNLDIAVPFDDLPKLKPGEYYWHQLIGLTVTNEIGYCFGQVTELMSTGANDVLVVEGEARFLIPFLMDRVIKHVDIENQSILVEWENDF